MPSSVAAEPDHRALRIAGDLPQRRPRTGGAPRPGVPEPDGRQQVQRRLLRAAVVHRDLHQQVLGGRLRVLDEDVEVAVLVEDARVEKLVLRLLAAPLPVRPHDVAVGVGGLGVLVEVLHVRVRGSGVEVEVVLLHVLAVIALAVGEAEQALLEDRVLAVPERERQADPLLVVRDSRDAVLAPAVGARACVVVGKVVPGVAVVAVVLTDGAPLALAQVGAPLLPGSLPAPRLFEALAFGGHPSPPRCLFQAAQTRLTGPPS